MWKQYGQRLFAQSDGERKPEGWHFEVHSVMSQKKPGLVMTGAAPRSGHFLPGASPSAVQRFGSHHRYLKKEEAGSRRASFANRELL